MSLMINRPEGEKMGDLEEKFDDQRDVQVNDKPEKKGFFKRLKEGLTKTRNNIAESFSNLFKANELDDDFYDELEETLIMSDMGYETSERIIDDLKDKVKELHIKEASACKELVINIIRDFGACDYDLQYPKRNERLKDCIKKYVKRIGLESLLKDMIQEISTIKI